MVFAGTVTNGVIVLDRAEPLPEGARVEVVVKSPRVPDEPLCDLLLKQAGCMTDLPEDFAEQHDHYIHGTSKR